MPPADHLFALPDLGLDAPLPTTADLRVERALAEAGFAHVAGTDEAGRGCLAGPVVAAAVILPNGVSLPGLTDSKQLTAQARAALVPAIEQAALAVGVGVCSPAEIDRWNILHASLEAMRRALLALDPAPDFVLVDGNRAVPRLACGQRTVVKGDARCLSIAAASVIAKETRDRFMVELDTHFPGYGLADNMGYPTAEHFAGLERIGPSPEHRRSFRLRVETAGQADLFRT